MAGDQGEAEEPGAPLSALQREGQRLALLLHALLMRGLASASPPRMRGSRPMGCRFPCPMPGLAPSG